MSLAVGVALIYLAVYVVERKERELARARRSARRAARRSRRTPA